MSVEFISRLLVASLIMHGKGAGVQRFLVLQVRSCTLDTWLPEQVEFMARTGNARANAFFEARLDAGLKPAYGSVDLEPFIRRKVWPHSHAHIRLANFDSAYIPPHHGKLPEMGQQFYQLPLSMLTAA